MGNRNRGDYKNFPGAGRNFDQNTNFSQFFDVSEEKEVGIGDLYARRGKSLLVDRGTTKEWSIYKGLVYTEF